MESVSFVCRLRRQRRVGLAKPADLGNTVPMQFLAVIIR